jgi:hypothetical protein
MKPSRLALASVALALLQASPASAAARVFVSVSGVDTGDCSNVAAPCRTLNFATVAVDAGGEVIVLTSGSYAGATLTKSVKINAPAGVVAFSASPIVVDATDTDDVVIRGLTIKALTPGTGNGIDLQNARSLHIENCVVDGWDKGGIVSDSTGDPEVYISDSIFRNSATRGFDVLGAASTSTKASVFRTQFVNNGTGCGFFNQVGNAEIRQSVASGNGNGFCSEGFLAVHNSTASHNTNAGYTNIGNGTIAVSASVAFDNDSGFRQLSTGSFFSLGNSLVRGNTTNLDGTITVVTGQ